MPLDERESPQNQQSVCPIIFTMEQVWIGFKWFWLCHKHPDLKPFTAEIHHMNHHTFLD